MHFIYQYYKSINPDPFRLKVWTDSDWSDLFRLRVYKIVILEFFIKTINFLNFSYIVVDFIENWYFYKVFIK